MKYIFWQAGLFVLAILLGGCLGAQNFPKKNIDGKDYYIYTVEPGNTLFGIAKSFSVPVEDLKRANPESRDGLQIGQELRVPITAIDRRQARRSDIVSDGEYLLHTVQRKETLFGISKKYGVSMSDLSELNPEEFKNLSIGDVLKIPVIRSSTVDERYLEPARNDTFIVHKVASGETLYSIAKGYELTVDSLKSMNPGLQESSLSTGAWIIVPRYNEAYLARMQAERDSLAVPSPYDGMEGSKESYNIALMLPFELHLNDSIEEDLKAGKDLFLLTEIALEFYRGTMIALDSLKLMGLSAEVFVREAGEDVVGLRESLRMEPLNDMDLVIGPMHKNSLALVSEASAKNGFYLVSPNSFGKEIFDENPYFFRASASRETLIRYLANYVAIHHSGDNVIMVNSESPRDWPFRKLFKKEYHQALQATPSLIRDSLLSLTRDQLQLERAEDFLFRDSLNVLVVPSNELAYVSDLVTKLISLEREGYPIQLYGMDQWVKYENIEASYKNRFRLRLPLTQHVNYTDDHLLEFLEKYRERYGTEPSRFAYGFQAYDLMMYFGTALLRYGKAFPVNMEELYMEGLLNRYRFGKNGQGEDFENKSVIMVEYQDYVIKRIN